MKTNNACNNKYVFYTIVFIGLLSVFIPIYKQEPLIATFFGTYYVYIFKKLLTDISNNIKKQTNN